MSFEKAWRKCTVEDLPIGTVLNCYMDGEIIGTMTITSSVQDATELTTALSNMELSTVDAVRINE